MASMADSSKGHVPMKDERAACGAVPVGMCNEWLFLCMHVVAIISVYDPLLSSRTCGRRYGGGRSPV